jgi:drug/metabolite transporter (DMT)-like permease
MSLLVFGSLQQPSRASEEAVTHRSVSNVGLAFGLLSGATFGTSGSLASSLIDAGWSPGAAVAARIAIAAAILTGPALVQLRSHRVTARAARGVAAYGVVAVAGAQLCYFNAVEHLSVAVALLIEYSGVVLIIGWMWARHGQRPRRLTTIGAAVAVAGLVLVLDLLGSHHLDPVGVLWGLGAAVGLAVYFVLSSTTDDALPPLAAAWGGLVVGAGAIGLAAVTGALPLRATNADVTLLDSRVSWVVPVLGMAIVAAVLAYVAGIAAARLLGAKIASFVGLTEVLFAVGFAWLLLGQWPGLVQLAGGMLVVAGIALVRFDELRPAPRPYPGRTRRSPIGSPVHQRP